MIVWDFLANEENRAILTLVGTGIAALVAAGWAVFRSWRSSRKAEFSPSVQSSDNSVAAGRDIRESKINIAGKEK
jgi:hypothetical protein